jgi:hypothetical protein
MLHDHQLEWNTAAARFPHPHPHPTGGSAVTTNGRARILAALAGPQWETSPRLPLVAAACGDLVNVNGAGVSLMTDELNRHVVHTSNAVMGRLEELQVDLDEGPCVDAFTTRRPVLEPELEDAIASGRWQHFAPAAIGAGARAVFAFPLQVGAIRLGSLDLYRDVAGMLTTEELGDALTLADMMTEIVLDLQAQVSPGVVHDQLLGIGGGIHAARIHQATGIVAVQLGVNTTVALACLRARASAERCRLIEVAAVVVSGELHFD